MIQRLKKYWMGYAKDQPPPEGFLEKLPQAVGRAQGRRKNLVTLGEKQPPFTDIDLLVSALNTATRELFQMNLTPPPVSRASRK